MYVRFVLHPLKKGINMLYNITFNKNNIETRLFAHIPYSAAADEDQDTERVCFSDSIAHCIEAIGPCERNLYTNCQIIVRSIDERYLDQSKIVTTQELYETQKVPDALETHECWYLDTVDVKREVYQVKDFRCEHTIAFSCLKRADVASLIEKYTPNSPMKRYESIEQAYNRTITKMQTDRQYDKSESFENEIAELPWAQRIRITNLVIEKIEQE